MKIGNPWRVESFLATLQRGGHYRAVRLPNGENFTVKPETTKKEMVSAQSRCICTAVYMMK
jgi:hypothetical protein